MKQITLTLAILFLKLNINSIFAQNSATPNDTMNINFSGEQISIPVPKIGHKTTINFEDSSSITQISVSKFSKSSLSVFDPKPFSATTPKPKKNICWFNEVELGSISLVNQTQNIFEDNQYPYFYRVRPVQNNKYNTTIYVAQKINSGFTVGFSIKERSRPILNEKIEFISGVRFRYSRYTGSGIHLQTTYYIDSSNRTNDSIVSQGEGKLLITTNNYQLIFPLLVQFNLKHKFKLSVGVNLALNIQSTQLKEENSSSVFSISYDNNQFIQFQPIAKLTYNKTSLYTSFKLGQTIVGEGYKYSIKGNQLYFGLAQKLY